MQNWMWVGLTTVIIVALAVAWAIALERSRKQAEVGMTPDQIRRKRALEGMVDNLNL